MRSFVQVLTTPTADTPGTTLLLHFDNKRYLIGSLAEGTQRACVQMGARILKVQECFISGRTEWSNIGGIIGMILTLADSSASSSTSSLEEALKKAHSKGKQNGWLEDKGKMKELEEEATKNIKGSALTFFGAPNLNHTLATARRFVFRKGLPVDLHEIRGNGEGRKATEDWEPYWADSNIKVWALPTLPHNVIPRTSRSHASSISRKRSHEEANGEVSPPPTRESDGLSEKDRAYLTTKAVVSEMFNSSWRLDTLYETPLSQVSLPAAIFVRDTATHKIEKYRGPLPGGEEPLVDPDMTVLVRKPWPGALIEHLPHTEPAQEAVSYIIRNHQQRGKFDPKRAKQHNVEVGPKWHQLQKGESVLNRDGATITPDMILGEAKVGGGFAVIDIPHVSYIENTLNHPEWKESKVMAGVGAIFWICGKNVIQDARIKDFMQHFSSLEHIVSSPDCCPNHIALDSVAAATVRMNNLDPSRYNMPYHDTTTYGNGLVSSPGKIHTAERGQVVQLEPSIEFQSQQVVPPISLYEVEADIPENVLDAGEQARQAVIDGKYEATKWAETIPDGNTEIITLGTGSALPSKYRNVSATLVKVPGWGCMLFDVGENTLGQLRRVFPPDELNQVLRELRALFISHMHADHHLGTASVIKAWYEAAHQSQPLPNPPEDSSMEDILAPKDRLAVISEAAMQQWLAEYALVEDFGFSRIAPLHISCAYPDKELVSQLTWFIPPSELADLSPESRKERLRQRVVPASLIGMKDVQAVAVRHCHGARAVSVTLPSGFKVSYSGDCRPSKAFAGIGQGSTVCIHEATFDDERQGDAKAKNHSTTSEALGIAQAMRAKTCILTHFSQRYQKLPVLEKKEEKSGDNEGLALQDGGDEDDSDAEVDAEMNPTVGDEGAAMAVTLPDQTTANGEGLQYELPSKIQSDKAAPTVASTVGAAAVKFKLTSDMKFCVAFDYMRVKVNEICQMEKFTPALLKLFAEEEAKEARRKAAALAEIEEKMAQSKAAKKQAQKSQRSEKPQKS